MEENETSVEQTGSEETESQVNLEDQSQEPEIDYRQAYEKAEQERRELATLLGRQGNELGELRKLVERGNAGTKENELNPYEFFDGDTAKAIEKITEQKAAKLFEGYQQQQEQTRLRNDFQSVYTEYDVNEENLSDLAFYANSKGISIKQAADDLAKKGIIEKRTQRAISRNVNLGAAPLGAPKNIGTSSGGIVRDPTKLTTEEWAKLSDADREALLKKYSSQ